MGSAQAVRAAIAALLCMASAAAAQDADRCAAPPERDATPLERGNQLLAAGEPSEALDAYQEAIRAAKQEGDARRASLASANAARAALDAGSLDGLDARLAAAEADAEALPDARDRARVLLNLGRTTVLLGEATDRRDLTLRAAALFTRAGELAAQAGDARLESYALGYRGELYLKADRREEALELTRRALFKAGEAEAPDALYRWQWQVGRIRRAQGQEAQAIDAYRQSVRTLEAIRAALATTEAALAFRSEVEPVYVGLVDLLLVRAARSGDGAERQALLAEARDTIEGLKAAELRDYYHDECLDAGRKATPDTVPGAVVVYPILLPDRVELVVSRGGTLESHRAPVDGPSLTAEVHAFRRFLEKRTTRQYRPHADRLYDWLIRPIESSLKGDVDTLVFVPGGALRTIPLAALRDRDTGKFLIERFPIAVTPGLTLTEPHAIDRDAVALLAAGISQATQGYPELPSVTEELQSVGTSFPGVELRDQSFQVARFETEVESRPFDIVHVASHGEFSADVSQSFLLAWDGRISMERLSALVGRTRFRDERPLELLTLSACQTAAGDDRAALGLAGVAVRAGARSVLATLWSVSDEATARLVSDFYVQLAKPGVSRARALQRAQIGLLRDHAFRHPAYWSPFLLISSWL